MKKITLRIDSKIISILLKGGKVSFTEPNTPEVELIPENHGYFIDMQDMARLQTYLNPRDVGNAYDVLEEIKSKNTFRTPNW